MDAKKAIELLIYRNATLYLRQSERKQIADLIESLSNPKGNIIYVHADDWARLQKENRELQRQATEAYQIIRDQIQEIRIISEESGKLKGAADAVINAYKADEYLDMQILALSAAMAKND